MAEPRGDDAPITGSGDDARRGFSRVGTVLAVALAVLAGLLVGAAGQRWLAGEAVAPPPPDSVDVGFARDMSVHHGQAVEMSAMALTNSDDPAVRTLAYDVITTQQSQIGTMQGWLTLWNRSPSATGAPMNWMSAEEPSESMDHSMPGMNDAMATEPSRMPGMATTEELAELRRTVGPAFDVRYLQLLLRHHQGGIPMAQYGAEAATVPAVSSLAEQMVDTQQAESIAIEQMLASKGAAPLPMN
ncbi:DUF305 domain-containing protein [Rhodococcus sp. ABRD24]|uniref:DUF305 domain-containing protein n=1 Tax=Rhodococcus sp. ABRD24 TaxID=2507582 RepID=UPI00103FC992|nr:DUF305 domain-containing protein [Rhodococcus sp. ABRD24]QBJ96343.1 DUF305 domain-containing protein [Rhodococcus sp. ABRD24]